MPQEEFDDIQDEGQEIPIDQLEKETPAAPSTDEQPVVEEPSQEGEEPAEVPNTPGVEEEDYKQKTGKRVQQLLKERQESKAQAEAYERELKTLREQQNPQNEVIPERFKKMFGDDPELWNEWKAMRQEEKEEAVNEAIQRIKSEQEQESKATEEMTLAYEAQLDDLEASGKKFDRNELMKYIAERPIFRQDGTPDFETALELMMLKKPKPNTQARKSIATLKMQSPVSSKGYATPDDLRGGFASI
jgi:hypothetical protein